MVSRVCTVVVQACVQNTFSRCTQHFFNKRAVQRREEETALLLLASLSEGIAELITHKTYKEKDESRDFFCQGICTKRIDTMGGHCQDVSVLQNMYRSVSSFTRRLHRWAVGRVPLPACAAAVSLVLPNQPGHVNHRFRVL